MNMNPESNVRNEIMSRVRTVRGVRGFFTSPLTSSLFGIALIACMSILVSLGDVFANTMAQGNWSERFSYAFFSFLHSRFIVQTLAGLILSTSSIAFISFIRKMPLRKFGIPFGSTQQV